MRPLKAITRHIVCSTAYPQKNVLLGLEEFNLFQNLIKNDGIITATSELEKIANQAELTGKLKFGADFEKKEPTIKLTPYGRFLYGSQINSILLANKQYLFYGIYSIAEFAGATIYQFKTD
ncbi:hypothetical protein J4403_04445 [Candidatus Woesearchaeota archaeon]|nr:hypothetical protein [Candidatus Woesearchaeota archaeon]